MKKTFVFILLSLSVFILPAANTEEVVTYSGAMKKKIQVTVITPDSYNGTTPIPVVYLLHGHGGNHKSWMREDLGVGALADEYNVIIVLPDGGRDSWYFDSPIDPTMRYETYMCRELVPYIDKNYKTIASRDGRGITGLSMGGHGALYLAFRNQDIFGVAGSMSGGVDIRPWPESWGISDRLGLYSTHPDNWETNTVINMTHLLTANSLGLIIDCGTEDFFYPMNEALHDKLKYNGIPHDYISRPGKHNWGYWKGAVKYQMLYMHNYFSSAVVQ